MSWIIVALSGYALMAVASVFDKFLLSERRLASPARYAFLVSLMNLPFLVLIPFGIVLFLPSAAAVGIVSGAAFLFSLLTLYRAVKQSEVSRSVPIAGAVSVGFMFALSIAVGTSIGRGITFVEVVAIGLLVGGAALLSSGGIGVRGPGFVRYVVLSGALNALSFILLRESYLLSNFVTGFVWSKVGMLLAGLSILLVPSWRKELSSVPKRSSKARPRRSPGTMAAFVATQVFGGSGTILVSYAVSLGSATLVQGMAGAQYGLVFLIASVLSVRFPAVFREHIGHAETVRKLSAIGLIALGIWLSALSGSGTNLL
ncbi:MAG: hypothetical protein HGA38_04340 [Candidatus Moranbacteria bacterium]|nr:hypothetical protein [Candidatus Moranbacteria bacterium]